jgi:hypothetical protein
VAYLRPVRFLAILTDPTKTKADGRFALVAAASFLLLAGILWFWRRVVVRSKVKPTEDLGE